MIDARVPAPAVAALCLAAAAGAIASSPGARPRFAASQAPGARIGAAERARDPRPLVRRLPLRGDTVALVQPCAACLLDGRQACAPGKRYVNFTRFEERSRRDRQDILGAVAREVRKGRMPLSSYTLIHRDARLSSADIDTIRAWAESEPSRLAFAGQR